MFSMKMSMLWAILTLCLFALSAAEYKTFEDAVKAAEVFIAEKYTTPIAKDSATKKLLLIVNDQTLPDAVKIENIQEFIRARTEENVKANTNLVKKAIPVKGQPWTVAENGMQLVYVAPGSFKMGEPKGGRDNEKPVHDVTLTQGYWIGKYEVTQNEYEKIMGNNPSVFKGNNKPVDGVSWYNAVIFCQKLTKRERAAGCLPAGYEYCLPTEAQWEFAARGGTESKAYKFSGGNNLDSLAWYYENSGNARLSDEWDVDNLDSNAVEPMMSELRRPMNSGFMICSGMSGNGAATGTQITRTAKWLILQEQSPVPVAYFAAAVGAAPPTCAVWQSAIPIRRIPGITRWVSVLRWFPV